MACTLVWAKQTCMQILLLTAVIHGLSLSAQKDRDDSENVTRFIQNYFPRESSLCVVKTGTCEGNCLPEFPLPVVLLTADKILQDCNRNLTEHDGYVFITSASADHSLESQTAPTLQCFSETTLTLKTKYILVVHYSELTFANKSNNYAKYLETIWETFGIANIAVLSVPKQTLSNSEPLVFSYNPFLARVKSIFAALICNDLSHDVRSEMKSRFRNMHGYTLKGVFDTDPFQNLTYKDFREKKTLGANPAILLKEILESYLGATIEVYAALKNNKYNSSNNEMSKTLFGELSVAELISGKADMKIGFTVLTTMKNPEKLENIHLDIDSQYVFIVPKPKEVESWTLFQYIFQWQVSASFGLVLLTLSGFAALFVHLQPSNHSQKATSEVVSVWKAVLTVSINKLPRSHNQRLLITVALLLGLIIMTVACAQLFALMKSKPKQPSIKTLHDLQNSNLPIHCILLYCGSAMDTFQNTSLSKLRSNLKTDKSKKIENMFDPRVLNITDRAILFTTGLLNILLSLSEIREFLQYFEIVGERALPSPLVLNLPKGTLYYDQFVNLNLRLTAGGLNKKQFEVKANYDAKKIATLSKTNKSVSRPHYTDENQIPLTYNDLEMAFYVLYIGLTASFICFIFEMLSG